MRRWRCRRARRSPTSAAPTTAWYTACPRPLPRLGSGFATPLADAQGDGARSAQAIVHHPDKSGDDATSSTAAADAFQAIQRAWEVLKVKARPTRATQWTRHLLPVAAGVLLQASRRAGVRRGSHHMSHPPSRTPRFAWAQAGEGTVGGALGRRADGCGR